MPLCKIGRVQLRTWLQQTIWSFRRKKTTATNENRTEGEAVSEKKLMSLWVCFDRQQEGLRQRNDRREIMYTTQFSSKAFTRKKSQAFLGSGCFIFFWSCPRLLLSLSSWHWNLHWKRYHASLYPSLLATGTLQKANSNRGRQKMPLLLSSVGQCWIAHTPHRQPGWVLFPSEHTQHTAGTA